VVDVLEALGRARARGERVVLVTVVAVDGDAPSHPGAKLAVGRGGVLAGTLGCAEFDTAGVELAAEALEAGGPLRRRRSFAGEEAHGRERALELFAEPHLPEPAVIVIGANPLGRALTALSELLGRRTVAIESDPAAFLREAPPGPEDAVILTDHDAPWVDEVLGLTLGGAAAYVGLPGSRHHAPQVVARLRSAGMPEEDVARLHSPVGLDIGSRTPEEIALSILAEVMAVSRGRPGGPMRREWLGGHA
jgi:xanthine dehydrogenase accessory factor